MSMARSAEFSKAYFNGAEAIDDLVERDADVSQALEFMASEQRRLIDLAKDVLEAPSAVGLVRSLLPPLMSDPFAELLDQVRDNGAVEEPVVDDAAAPDEADEDDD